MSKTVITNMTIKNASAHIRTIIYRITVRYVRTVKGIRIYNHLFET